MKVGATGVGFDVGRLEGVFVGLEVTLLIVGMILI